MLDSSAVLAIIQQENGAEQIKPWLPFSVISTVNLAEVVTKLCEKQVPEHRLLAMLANIELDVREFDQHLAIRAGLLRTSTRAFGLSLGDRACLALAESLGCPAITTDKAWGKLDIGIAIEVVR